MVIKAYHHVYNFPVLEILEKGVILPAAYRIDPRDLEGSCFGELDELKENILGEGGNPVGALGVELLMRERLGEIIAVSSQETDDTGFFCGDLLAGDVFSVFLSAGEWGRGDAPEVPNGFVFDAVDLIQRGAAVRKGDLMEPYLYEIQGMAWTKAKSPESARTILKRKLSEIKKEGELKGDRAIQELKKNPGEWYELVFPGVVEVEWVKEVWENGVLVSSLASDPV